MGYAADSPATVAIGRRGYPANFIGEDMSEIQRASDMQEGGRHYKDMPIQPAEFCQRNRLNWCESNAIKYVVRHASKNGAQDIKKAIHYLNLLLEWEYPGMTKTAADYTPLSPSEVKEIAESVAPPVLCDTCVRDKCPPDQRGGIATECAGYLSPSPPPSDEWETKDLCRRCGRVFLPSGKRCDLAGEKRKVANCENFASNAVPLTPAPLSLSSAKFSYNFPAAEKFMGMLKSDYVVKLRSEVSEVSDAIGPRDAAIELMDVIHVAETAIRTLAQDYGLDLDDLADHVVAKNRQRGYYQR